MAMARINTAEGGCATHLSQAAALFHPSVSIRYLDVFRTDGAEIRLVGDLMNSFHAALVFGGDGTIHRHLRPLIEFGIPLLPVPIGSGNDFAHALGIHSVGDSVRAWQQFCAGGKNVQSIDAGLVRSHRARSGSELESGNAKLETYFCNIAGVGLDCEANRRANSMPRWLRGHGGYIVAALGAILSFRPTVVTVMSAGQTKISQPAVLVAVANSASYGSGMRIAPRAQLSDGLLDVCFIRQVGRLRLLRYFPRVFRGEHVNLPEVEYFQTSHLRIESERPLDLYADGERVCQTPLEISVLPGRLRVIGPSP